MGFHFPVISDIYSPQVEFFQSEHEYRFCSDPILSSLNMNTTSFIRADNLHKTFKRVSATEKRMFKALDGVSFDIDRGESVALLGASGSGKSTLIRMLCALDCIDAQSGGIWMNGEPIQQNGKVSAGIRAQRQRIGIIFQQFNLVGQLDVMTNVLIGCLPVKSPIDVLLRRFSQEDRIKALECLDKVGLANQAYQRASTLSGGQQQRVAVARALLKGADLLLADEPVASLDPQSSKKVMDVLFGLTRDLGMTLVVSLHQLSVAQHYCKRAIGLSSGKVVFDGPTSALDHSTIRRLYNSQDDHSNQSDFSDHSALSDHPDRSNPLSHSSNRVIPHSPLEAALPLH